MSDVVGPSATTSNVADDEVLRRERLLQLIPSEKEYKKLEENKSLFPPDPKVYGHALKYTKSPAFPAIDDDDKEKETCFGGVPALGGRKYEHFKGRYMGLAPKGHSSGPLPFPLEEDAVKQPHFFYVQYLDGGEMAKELARLREETYNGKIVKWPTIEPSQALRDPVGYGLSSGMPVPGTWISLCGKYAIFPRNVDKIKYAYLAKYILPDKQNFVEFGIHRVLLKGNAGLHPEAVLKPGRDKDRKRVAISSSSASERDEVELECGRRKNAKRHATKQSTSDGSVTVPKRRAVLIPPKPASESDEREAGKKTDDKRPQTVKIVNDDFKAYAEKLRNGIEEEDEEQSSESPRSVSDDDDPLEPSHQPTSDVHPSSTEKSTSSKTASEDSNDKTASVNVVPPPTKLSERQSEKSDQTATTSISTTTTTETATTTTTSSKQQVKNSSTSRTAAVPPTTTKQHPFPQTGSNKEMSGTGVIGGSTDEGGGGNNQPRVQENTHPRDQGNHGIHGNQGNHGHGTPDPRHHLNHDLGTPDPRLNGSNGHGTTDPRHGQGTTGDGTPDPRHHLNHALGIPDPRLIGSHGHGNTDPRQNGRIDQVRSEKLDQRGYGQPDLRGPGHHEARGYGEHDPRGYGEPDPRRLGHPDSRGPGQHDPRDYGPPDPRGPGHPDSRGPGQHDPRGYGHHDPRGYGPHDPRGYRQPDPRGYGHHDPQDHGPSNHHSYMNDSPGGQSGSGYSGQGQTGNISPTTADNWGGYGYSAPSQKNLKKHDHYGGWQQPQTTAYYNYRENASPQNNEYYHQPQHGRHPSYAPKPTQSHNGFYPNQPPAYNPQPSYHQRPYTPSFVNATHLPLRESTPQNPYNQAQAHSPQLPQQQHQHQQQQPAHSPQHQQQQMHKQQPAPVPIQKPLPKLIPKPPPPENTINRVVGVDGENIDIRTLDEGSNAFDFEPENGELAAAALDDALNCRGDTSASTSRTGVDSSLLQSESLGEFGRESAQRRISELSETPHTESSIVEENNPLAEGGEDSDDEMEEVPEVREIEETPHRIGDGRLPKGTLANFLNEFKKQFFSRLDNFDERLKAIEDKIGQVGGTGKGRKRPEPKELSSLKNPFENGFKKLKLRLDLIEFNEKLRDPGYFKMMFDWLLSSNQHYYGMTSRIYPGISLIIMEPILTLQMSCCLTGKDHPKTPEDIATYFQLCKDDESVMIIVRLLTNFTRLYLELYDALKGPRRQSTKRNANGRAVPPTPPQPAPTPPVDGQEVLEPDDDYYQSDTDEKRKRFRQHFANIRNQERNRRNMIRAVHEKDFKFPDYPGKGRGQRVVFSGEYQTDILAWYNKYQKFVGPLRLDDIIRRSELLSTADSGASADHNAAGSSGNAGASVTSNE